MDNLKGRQRYEGKAVLVTGGAAGIGRAVVTGMAQEGARVVFTDISEEAGQRTEKELRDQDLEVHFKLCDGTVEASVKDLTEYTIATLGALDIAVNNIGNFGKGETPDLRIETMEHDVWISSLNQSLSSCMLGMKYQLRHMLEVGGGVIANTSSLGGIRMPITSPAYLTAKAGVIHLSRYVAVHYADRNIRCNCVAPGMVATAANLDAFPDPVERQAYVARFQPIPRLIEPNEIADAFLWVCSNEASMVTGQTISVDGGWEAT